MGVRTLLLSCESQVLNSGFQTLWQEPLPAEPFHQPCLAFKWCGILLYSTTKMSLEELMQTELRHTQRTIYNTGLLLSNT